MTTDPEAAAVQAGLAGVTPCPRCGQPLEEQAVAEVPRPGDFWRVEMRPIMMGFRCNNDACTLCCMYTDGTLLHCSIPNGS